MAERDDTQRRGFAHGRRSRAAGHQRGVPVGLIGTVLMAPSCKPHFVTIFV